MAECVSQTLILPVSAVKGGALSGVGMDFGGSLIKVVYATNHGDEIHIHFSIYPTDDVPQVLETLKTTLSGHLKPGQELITTGLGCNQYRKHISQALNVKVKNVMEAGLNSDALVFLVEKFPLSDYVCSRVSERAKPFVEAKVLAMESVKFAMNNEAEAGAGFEFEFTSKRSLAEELMSLFVDVDSKAPTADAKDADCPIKFPVFMCFLGSGLFYCTTEADRSFKFEGSYISCGKMLMGIGSLLTGAKTFDELMTLAEAGDSDQVDAICKYYKDSESQDPYAILPDDAPIYCFGNASGKSLSDFKREDVAAALISQFAMTQAHICHQAYLMSLATTVVFAGSVCCENKYMRDEITKHFVSALYMKPKETKTELYFLKQGAYLGALGALIEQNKTT